MVTVAGVPAAAVFTTVHGTELRVRNAVAMSHDLVNLAVPVGLNWNLQSQTATHRAPPSATCKSSVPTTVSGQAAAFSDPSTDTSEIVFNTCEAIW